MESLIRKKLAHLPALKLMLKGAGEFLKLNFYQSRNSFSAVFDILKINLKRFITNKRIVSCNYCGWSGNSFYPHNTRTKNMPNELCPKCLSIPRYRVLMEFLKNKTDFFERKGKVLEIGPNRSLQEFLLRKKDFSYISVDIKSPQAMIKMDMTDLKFSDESFDFVFAVSVLAFVDDDIKAMKEMYRVLNKNGFALISANINEDADKTIEYGKADPKKSYARRLYGKDITEKLKSVGFKTERYDMKNEISPEKFKEYAIKKSVIYKLSKK